MGGPSGEALVLLAAVVSFQLAAGKSAEQIELISAFFEILGDNLALLAARMPPTQTAEDTPGCGTQQD
ncbi:MAG: hypothetical protein HFE97_07160 [Oscillospiraceae bacterium]|nr:hypothetical protein [Oscillospiraceae bacterium]